MEIQKAFDVVVKEIGDLNSSMIDIVGRIEVLEQGGSKE